MPDFLYRRNFAAELKSADETPAPSRGRVTLDWEAIFENPDNGLIAAVLRANNPETLHTVTLDVIRQIYARRSDHADVERLTARVSRQISSPVQPGGFAGMIETIVRTFRDIKEYRKQCAAEYRDMTADEAGESKDRDAA